MRTYISLFSSAGVGCFGFKKEGFECVATNELLEKRLNIQKINGKCKYESGYICGDITKKETKDRIYEEIEFWKQVERIKNIDVVMATPPCQGMSTANYKKGDEIDRNSLVVEAIHMIKSIKPRIFVFENVRAFLTTMCIDNDESVDSIENCIKKHLEKEYSIFSKVINFSEYGVPSSRPRTIVIGTLKAELNFSPLNIFPLRAEQKTVFDAIGDLCPLDYGCRDSKDILHSFRVYPQYMQEWIHDLKEGETAFDNVESKKPYKIVNGKRQILKSGHMGNKFRRMFWNLPAPCITTRNDQLASQSTIHPRDDRVLSIRELMRLMTIPDDFKWVESENYSTEAIDRNETLIRQSIGEAVPTYIIQQIAHNIVVMLDYDDFIVNERYKSESTFCDDNFYISSFLYEYNLSDAKETGSFYTPQNVVYNTICRYKPQKEKIKLLEPSIGMGAFIPQILRLVDDCSSVSITCVDISQDCLDHLRELIINLQLNKKFEFKYIASDFLMAELDDEYDAVFANPPYFKMAAQQKALYRNVCEHINDNIFCLFMKRLWEISDEIMIVIPKIFLMIPDCDDVRIMYELRYSVKSVYDYGVSYFKKVFIEILSIHFSKDFSCPTYICDCRTSNERTVPQGYIYHKKMWLLYRDEWFDNYIDKLALDVFDYYRDRQLTNRYLQKEPGKIWVIRSKNLLEDGTIVHKPEYDRYTDSLDGFTLNQYYGKEQYIFINFTYNTRATILPKDCTVNGSFCILLPKKDDIEIDLALYASEEFRRYYSIVKNKSKFTINVDKNTIYYIGVKKND